VVAVTGLVHHFAHWAGGYWPWVWDVALGLVVASLFLFADEMRRQRDEARTEVLELVQQPGHISGANLDTLASLFSKGDLSLLSFEATASALPNWDWDWAREGGEGYEESQARIKPHLDKLNDWTTECDRTVRDLLGPVELALMEQWSALDAHPPADLNGWEGVEWRMATQRLTWLKHRLEIALGY
jgi:hypothetical protein